MIDELGGTDSAGISAKYSIFIALAKSLRTASSVKCGHPSIFHLSARVCTILFKNLANCSASTTPLSLAAFNSNCFITVSYVLSDFMLQLLLNIKIVDRQ